MSRLTFYTVEKLSKKQSITPEGFLLCEEVPIARTGMILYGPDETPIEAGPDGLVKIFREAEHVFADATIASFQGKPVTDDHPSEDVTPENWKGLAIGSVMNVRRGEGAMDDLLIADLLITDKDGIEAIQSGKREVSCGYDAEYVETAPGCGVQTNIRGNHVALVDAGRCGSRCAVGDRKFNKETQMAKKSSKIADAIAEGLEKLVSKAAAKDAGRVRDEDLPEAAEEGDVHIHVHANPNAEGRIGDEEPEVVEEAKEGVAKFSDADFEAHVAQNEAEHKEMRERIEALERMLAAKGEGVGDEEAEQKEIEGELKEEAPVGTGDEEMEQVVKAKDSRYLGESFKDTVAMAEILVPGIRIPTFDAAAKPAQTFKKICHFRRQALDVAYAQPSTRALIDDILAGKALDTKNMTCDTVRTLFRAAHSAKKAVNNSGAGRTGDMGGQKLTTVSTLAEINKRQAEYWAKH